MLYFWGALPLAFNIGCVPHQNWISQKSTKGGPSGSVGGRIPEKRCPPLHLRVSKIDSFFAEVHQVVFNYPALCDSLKNGVIKFISFWGEINFSF